MLVLPFTKVPRQTLEEKAGGGGVTALFLVMMTVVPGLVFVSSQAARYVPGWHCAMGVTLL